MKVTELQIGDYVRLKRTNEIVGVFEIDGDRNVINNEPDGYCSEKNIAVDDIEPITLTPEILEKNGFKKYEKDYHNEYVCEKCDETSYYEIVICWKDSYDNGALDAFNHVQWDEGWKIDIISEGSYSKGWCKTIYLHELQHALRLCGLDELADNFKLEE